jgi:glucose/arabinose dehydrogenase/mono/diheme cytochrome c family protein
VRLILFSVICLILALPSIAQEDTTTKPSLPEWLTIAAQGAKNSRVIGTPEPPAPYRVEKALPEFPIQRLISFRFEPGTGALVYIDQAKDAKGTRLMRYDFKTKQAELLIEPNEFIYGFEFHPKYRENGYVFLGSNGPATAERIDKRALIMRYTVDRGPEAKIDPASAFEILQWPSKGHNGTAIAFGSDGMMYFTSGDGTSDSDEDVTGQRLDLYLAKVMRVDVDHPDPGKPYSIPKDNPFLNTPGAKPETWAYGFRNPWRASWDAKLNRLWVGQNGQDRLEQAFLVEKGANYGWSVYEGSRIFYEKRQLGPTPVSPPTLEHGHHESRSLTGGSVYTGDKLPDLTGAYVYGDYTTGKIWGARHDGKKVTWNEELCDTRMGVTDFITTPDGEMWISNYQPTDEGGLYKLTPNPPIPNAPKFPKKLSETGLFKDVTKHQPDAGVIPYSVQIPQWSDGAYQERYIALSAAEPRIGFGARRGWEFPDGTVAVQSLAIGDAKKKRWVETRLMHKLDGDWAAYTYEWNAAQTDAELVPEEGKDATIDGQPWRFASRAECGVCHSRSGNFILGLQSGQMNRPHDYGGGFSANQLEVLDRLGLFRKKDAPPTAPSPLRGGVEKQERFPDPADTTADVDTRMRAFFHTTCSHCHVESGGGNSQIDLRAFIDLEKMKIINEKPNHGTVGLAEATARLVVPGNAANSILFSRVVRAGPGQMPPMGSSTPDPRAVGLLAEWIAQVKVPEPKPAPDAAKKK